MRMMGFACATAAMLMSTGAMASVRHAADCCAKHEDCCDGHCEDHASCAEHAEHATRNEAAKHDAAAQVKKQSLADLEKDLRNEPTSKASKSQMTVARQEAGAALATQPSGSSEAKQAALLDEAARQSTVDASNVAGKVLRKAAALGAEVGDYVSKHEATEAEKAVGICAHGARR